MQGAAIACWLAGCAIAVPWAAAGQTKGDLGKFEYESSCAICHGMEGKGDGPWPFATMGSPPVADLTTLARRNGRRFPFQRVYETIDGRSPVRAHGPSDMPVWGSRYRTMNPDAYFEAPYDPDAYVRTRILALTEYVYRLQAK